MNAPLFRRPEGVTEAHTLGERELALEADVLVIGSGAGGSVVACELAEAGRSVLVLEEGPFIPPERYGKFRPSESLRHLWIDAGLAFAVGIGDSPMINMMMGRAIGGSSILTGGVCFRIPDVVLHEWSRDLGLDELTPAGLEAAHAYVERSINVEEVPAEMRSRSTLKFWQGAEKLGVPMKPLRRNTQGCNGCGRCNFGCPHGAKLSVDVTFLPRALAAGARVYSNVRVDGLTYHGDHVTGCQGRVVLDARGTLGARVRVRARRVVVSAGAYGTPLLLERSGLGKKSGQLGRNMTVHPSFRVMARFDEPILGWKGALQSAYTDAFERDGVTLTGLFVPPGVLAATMPGIGPEHRRRARQIPNLAIFGGMIHDQGGGQVSTLFGRPLMTYRMAPQDRASVSVLMRRMAEIFFASGAREVFLPVLGLGGIDPDRLKTLDLDRVKGREIECGSQHPLGTARMGVDARNSVVDPDGQAWEVRGLYVADGSILPTSLGVNPQLSIMTMAARIAWKLREQRF